MKSTQIETLLLKSNEANVAADIIKKGGIVAIPTETVYGLAANALNESAVKKIFTAKGRPQDNPLIVHISSYEMLNKLVRYIPKEAKCLSKTFWPGPLTIILPKSEIIPSVTSAGLDTVAIRMPSHPIAREIIELAGVPIAAPSANLSGKPSPTQAQHCINDLWGRVDAILDAGKCEVGVESTVITLCGNPRILRPGFITVQQIEKIIGTVEIDNAVTGEIDVKSNISSPGMKYKHYAPNAEIILVNADLQSFANFVNSLQEDFLVLLSQGEEKLINKPYITYGKNVEENASQLFSALRLIDDKGAKKVYVRTPEKKGVGLAIYNRLVRAAAFKEISL